MAERLTAYCVRHDVAQGCLTKNEVTDIIIIRTKAASYSTCSFIKAPCFRLTLGFVFMWLVGRWDCLYSYL